jgi:hypothetical protein
MSNYGEPISCEYGWSKPNNALQPTCETHAAERRR